MNTTTKTSAPAQQFEITVGSRQVVICRHDRWSRWDTDGGVWYSARLYVNNGETATRTEWKGKTEAGARRWAFRTLAKFAA